MSGWVLSGLATEGVLRLYYLYLRVVFFFLKIAGVT